MRFSISIIIPIYNVEKYILLCLQSVANQTKTDGIECILVDDCGTDNSVALAKMFIDDYTGNIKFSLISHKKNGGLSSARNTGIENASGEYLYFLDSDDEISPNCMEIMWKFISMYGKVDMVQGSFFETGREYRTLSRYRFPKMTNDRKQIKSFLLTFAGDIIGAQSRLIRKDILIRHHLFFKEGIIHEDNYWTFFLAKYIKSMAFCPVRTYYHRCNLNSITVNVNVPKETLAYKTIITDLSANIDPLLPGRQKELILDTLLTALSEHFYENDQEKDILIKTFENQNTSVERMLLNLYFGIRNKFIKTKILHLLKRIYKLKD